MSSNLLRLAVVVLACIAGLSAATWDTCPSAAQSTDFFAATNCSAVATCASTRCTCNNGTYNATTAHCALNSERTCATATPCQAQFIQCVQAAAETSSCLANLKVVLLALISGGTYNGSTVQTACEANTCMNFNDTVTGNCSLAGIYPSVCIPLTAAPTPIPDNAKYTAEMTLGGEYDAIIASATATKQFLGNVTIDLNAKFKPVDTNATLIRKGSAVVTFVANVAANDPAFAARVASAAAEGATWLTNAKASFTALGGTGTFSLIGIKSVTPGAPTNTTAAPTPTPTKGASGVSYVLAVLVAALVAILA